MTAGPLRIERDVRSQPTRPHNLVYVADGAELHCLALDDHMATRIEAQIAQPALRIVDAAASLPPWPDLTALRAIVDRAKGLDVTDRGSESTPVLDAGKVLTRNEAEWVGLAFEALTAAIHLCHNHPPTGSENP